MAKSLKGLVIGVERLTDSIVRIRFLEPEIASHAHAGHFINILVSNTLAPFWRRPFSIHKVNRREGWAEILFEIVGTGTEILARSKKGDILDFIGPLGQPFQLASGSKNAILIAGGLGIAPMILLCQDLVENDIPIRLFYGAQNSNDLCCLDELEAMGVTYHVSTDDGSMGKKGLITDVLASFLKHRRNEHLTLFACGPMPMLARVQALCVEYRVSGQVSVETLMACGFGACMGCNIKTLNNPEQSYVLVCKDGPVFPITNIQFHG